MIVRNQSDGSVVMITQNDHAKLAGLFAAHWGNRQFERPRPYTSMMRAAQYHDGGWLRYETNPYLDPATGKSPELSAGSHRRSAACRLSVGDRHAHRGRQLHRPDGEQAPHRAVAIALRRDHAAAAGTAAQAHRRHRGLHRAQRGAAACHHRRPRPPRGRGELQSAAGLGPAVALHLQQRAAQGPRDRAGADRATPRAVAASL